MSDAEGAVVAEVETAEAAVVDFPDETEADSEADEESGRAATARGRSIQRLLVFPILPIVGLALVVAAGYLKFVDSSARGSQVARIESVQVAKDGAVAILSYAPDTADATLNAARDRLTGSFKDSYTSLVHDVVIPGAQQKKVSATVTVPAAASISATIDHAVVLVFVNQAVIVGNGAPTSTASAVEVTLEKINDRWLISGFDPR